MKRSHAMPFGASPTATGGARFRLWAPAAREVHLVRPAEGREDAMQAADGWFELELAHAAPGLRYAFRIDGGTVVPDPASRSNPDDVHGPSALIDPSGFDWPDAGWRGRPWSDAVIYELHVGCFSRAGTFLGAIDQLDDLVALGVTTIELMPLADFPGRRGWGYDGVLLFAPESGYGSPDELKQLVAAAHARGLMVLLDVVYNHFGPDGNYLHVYAKPFFNSELPTPWGAAINFDAEHSRTVRDFYIHNALYWLEEFHFDGLRIDAVHAMYDRSSPHFIDELVLAVRQGPGRDRAIHVVLENHANDAARLVRHPDGRPHLADAQWNDDVHHAVHVLATGEIEGYYVDFSINPLTQLGIALAEGFAYQGEPSVYADGNPHGTPSAHLSPLAFVNSIQTHDQIGNRAFGDRIAQQAAAAGGHAALSALTASVLLAPAPPMLFMGEEYAASTPFQYFCDFQGELALAVTRGRRLEFGRFARFSDPALRDQIPDPNAESTFANSKLDWSERARAPHAEMLALYTRLLRTRRQELMPWLTDARSGRWTIPEPGTLRIRWPLGGGRTWHMLARLANHHASGAHGVELPGRVVYRSHPPAAVLPAWSVQVALEQG
jgi:maltooligosyltrehalose trehalohydrolase